MQPRDVVDVRVRDDDRANLQIMAPYGFQNLLGVATRIDDQRFQRPRISHDVAIALQHPHGKNFVDELACRGMNLNIALDCAESVLVAASTAFKTRSGRLLLTCRGKVKCRWRLHCSTLHRSANAEIGEYFGTLLPARFGDFAAEYSTARESVALVDTNFRAFFQFLRADAQRYVNAVLTSNVRDLKPGLGTVGLLLTPQGHILAEVETLALDSSILAASHAMVRERTFSTFDKFIIMDDVTLMDVTPSTGTLDLVGPRAVSADFGIGRHESAELAEFAHREVTLGSIPCRVVHHKFAGHPSAMLIAAAREL